MSDDLDFERWWIKFYDDHYLENALKPDLVRYKKIASYAWSAAKENKLENHLNA